MSVARTKKEHHDDTDVDSALKRETTDGSGFDSEDELPASDFEHFAEEDVENDADGTDNIGSEEGVK